jgi:hypothetical protein
MIFILFSMNFRTLKEFPGIFNWITNLEKGKGMNRCGLTIDIRPQLAAFLAQSMTLRGGPAVRGVRRSWHCQHAPRACGGAVDSCALVAR